MLEAGREIRYLQDVLMEVEQTGGLKPYALERDGQPVEIKALGDEYVKHMVMSKDTAGNIWVAAL